MMHTLRRINQVNWPQRQQYALTFNVMYQCADIETVSKTTDHGNFRQISDLFWPYFTRMSLTPSQSLPGDLAENSAARLE